METIKLRPLEKIARRKGLENVSPNSKFGKLLRAHGIQRTREWERIDRLPRRRWQDSADLNELIDLLNLDLRTEGGEHPCSDSCRCPRGLRPNQAAALRDAHDVRGVFLPQGVGKGKSLISVLLPTVLYWVQRPVLVVPARLVNQTLRDVLPKLKKHWRIRDDIKVVPYSQLSLKKNADLWDELKPDLIIADEGHRFKNKDAALTKRLARYMRENPQTIFCVMSGTMTKRRIEDFAHLLAWSLKEDQAPLPMNWPELSTWGRVINADVPPDQREKPGVLVKWCADGESVTQGFGRRLTETPGVVATESNEIAASLRVYKLAPTMPPDLSQAIDKMAATWETPNGDIITEALELWQHQQEMSLGFWSRWVPPPPEKWLTARREWNKYVRDTLKSNGRRLDSPLQVWNEQQKIERTGLDALDRRARVEPSFLAWREIKDSYHYETEAVWVSDYMLRFCHEWLLEHQGICWVWNVAFGEALAKLSGFPYFGAGDRDDEALRKCEGGPIIASIRAHGEGKNLQDRWAKNLVPSPSASGSIWEQLIGRTHREGQNKDEVEFFVSLHTDAAMASFKKAFNDALYQEKVLGAQQKLLIADFDFSIDGLSRETASGR